MVTYEPKDRAAPRAGERRRAELGEFLKARRARLSPGDFGMPPGSRRRTPGLRREEVALLAGVGVTWYTWLEQGRQINASTEVLDRHIGDPDWEEDIRRLASLSREFAELWARHEAADSEPRVLTYLHPSAGTLSFAVSELEVPDMPEARIVVYTPRDDDTRARMPLTRRTVTPAQATV